MAQHPPTGRELSITRDLPLIDEDIVPTTHLCGDAEGAEDIDYGLREILVVVEPLHRIVSDDAEVQIPQIVIDCTTTRDSTKDRKSTRLNSSHVAISYAVFCLKKKKHQNTHQQSKPLQLRNNQNQINIHTHSDIYDINTVQFIVI